LVHLLYGARYDGAIAAVTWNLVIAGVVVVNGASAAVLTASDRQADRIRVVACTLVVNVALGFYLIPRYGLHGAIASFGLSQLFETVYAGWYAGRHTRVRLDYGTMSRLLLAALVATGLSHATTQILHVKLAFLGGAIVFIVAYSTLSVILRTWRAADFETFAHIAGRLGHIGTRMSGSLLVLRRFANVERTTS
jgi:O-antigen/teichoic acid export membrane protein